MSIAIKPRTADPIAIKIAFCIISFQSLISQRDYTYDKFLTVANSFHDLYFDLYSQECFMTPLPATLKDLLSIRLPSL